MDALSFKICVPLASRLSYTSMMPAAVSVRIMRLIFPAPLFTRVVTAVAMYVADIENQSILCSSIPRSAGYPQAVHKTQYPEHGVGGTMLLLEIVPTV